MRWSFWSNNKPSPTINKRKVLVVDDEDFNRDSYAEILERGGYLADKAGSSEEALELMKRNAYSAILSDFNLGPGDGFRLLLSKMEGAGIKVPVVLMSGDTERPVFKSFLQQGAIVSFIQKPARREVVLKSIADAIAVGEKNIQSTNSMPGTPANDRSAGRGGIA